jgi:hypothetical protein
MSTASPFVQIRLNPIGNQIPGGANEEQLQVLWHNISIVIGERQALDGRCHLPRNLRSSGQDPRTKVLLSDHFQLIMPSPPSKTNSVSSHHSLSASPSPNISSSPASRLAQITNHTMGSASSPATTLFTADVVPQAPEDPLFGLMKAYREDSFDKKVDLGIGAYRDNNAKPWVLPVVKKVCLFDNTVIHAG